MSGPRRQIPEETLPAVTHLARAVAHHGRRLSSIKVENRSSVCRWPGEPRVDARRPRVTKSADHQHFGAMPKIACHGVTVIGFHTSPHRSQTARRSRQRGSTCFASQLRTDGGRTATQVFAGRMYERRGAAHE
jgi:hypothetical protein